MSQDHDLKRREFLGGVAMERLDQAFAVIRNFKPLPPEKMAELENRARADALTGKFELFKTSTRFDGTIKNPQWMG